MVKITKKKFIESVEGSRGILSVVARKMNVSRMAIYKFLRKYPDMWDELENEAEKRIDLAESVIDKRMLEGDIRAAEIVLVRNKRGRARGYGDRTEIEHSGLGDTEINIQIIKPYNEKHKVESDSETV